MPPETPPPRRRRGWKIFSVLLTLVALFVLISIWALSANSTRIVLWALQRAMPKASIELRAARLSGVTGLVIEKLVIRDAKTRQEALRMDEGEIIFTLADLRHARIGNIRLVRPVITASPRLAGLLPGGGGGGSGPRWVVGRILCDYGEIHYAGEDEHSPVVRLKFAMDWKEVGAAETTDAPLGLTLWDVQVFAPKVSTPFLVVDLIQAQSSLGSLLHRNRIDDVKVRGGRLVFGKDLQSLFSGPAAASKPPEGGPWTVGNLEIQNIAVRVDDNRPEVNDITFVINTQFRDLPLRQTADALGEVSQTVEIADLEVLSPYDPLTKVLTLRSIFLTFRLAGLLHQELDTVKILNPTIHVGEDLFWYMKDTQDRLGTGAGGGSGAGWRIHNLEVQFGRLVFASSGREGYGLPLNFRTTATDIALNDLASLKLDASLEIPAQDYVFETYQIAVSTKQGELRFSYPPEKQEKNLVGRIFLNRATWRQYETTDAWVSATFDEKGINANFGGRAYGGYLKGGFSFLFAANSPWIGWVAGDRVSLRQLTDIVAPQNFRMTGPLNFRLQMDAFGSNISRIKGDFQTLKPGRLTISKLDDLLANIPDTWSNLKQSGTRLALEALREFDYTKAGGDLWFVEGQGVLDLRLQGPLGSRNFDVVLHADDSREGQWKKPR